MFNLCITRDLIPQDADPLQYGTKRLKRLLDRAEELDRKAAYEKEQVHIAITLAT